MSSKLSSMARGISPFLLIITLFVNAECIRRGDFPDGFVFGTASSAYQFEGAANEGNKGASIWDTFTRQPGRILDFSNADIAVDQYHRFEGDIDLMKDLGVDAYRFSISWPRIFPCKFQATCFQAFGDRVKHWISFNEPHGFSIQGYDTGIQAPGRCSILGGFLCKTGNSSTEPYIVAHNILLSHAAVYRTYHLYFKVFRIEK